MTNYQWVDITAEIISIQKELKLMETIKDADITLEDCMQAQQINDDKMDPKFDISYSNTIKYKLQQSLVKLPQQLTIKQMAVIFANILQLQASTLQLKPLQSTIYSFSYLYDRKIFSNSILFSSLYESINSIGSYVYNVIKQSNSVKEDDIHTPPFSFIMNSKNHDEVSQMILSAEKKFQSEYKKNEDKASYNFVMNSLKFRRSMHGLAKNLGISFDAKNLKKIQTDLQGSKKKLAALEELNFPEIHELLEGVFFSDLQKTLRVHFGPRQVKLLTLKDSFQEFKNLFQQLEFFVPLSTKVTEIKNRIQILQSKPLNGWSKSYIKNNMFLKQNHFFTLLKTQDALVSDINDWVHLPESVKQHEKFKALIGNAGPVISQTIYRLLGNSMRWQWQCSKIYEDYNILIHMATEADSVFAPGTYKDLYTSSWFYYYVLELMIKQLTTGFEINLYQPAQLKYVFYTIDNILNINQRIGNIFMRKLQKLLIQSFKEGNINKKQLKKLNNNQILMFSNILFKKGMLLYFKAAFKLICILHARNLVKNAFEATEEIRVKNRFRIFKNIIFLKPIEYQVYRKNVDEVVAKQDEMLSSCLQELKQVKSHFKLLSSQFQSTQLQFRQKQDADLLSTLSVKASLVVMTIKMNGGTNKKFGINVKERYPEFTMQ